MSAEPGQTDHAGLAALAERFLGLAKDEPGFVVAVTGSVASGKTTLAERLAAQMGRERSVETVSTDGFLFPNATLDERGLMMRKGFPETYDRAAMAEAIAALRAGEAAFPVHSHVIYDIDPALTRTLSRPDILILEGLGFSPLSKRERGPGEPDVLVYLDAAQADIEHWFLTRFMGFWHAAEHDPTSFYAQFRHMSVPEAEAFAMQVWETINLPNLKNHIEPLREYADIVLNKARDHTVSLVADRL
ncbi:MAG: hypothetical protein WA989_15325 [Henriciella sp.]|uniref:type I pantothenate kinase n=1 Tax=Henriciella sp. TaxID=1968823 RepID=UPI003C79533F